MADSMTVLRKAGPPGMKRNIVILGDGFAAADQAAYNQWVETTLIQGVFGHDYFSEDASAYNIYRINLESVDSGVSVRTYDEKGTVDPSDDTIAAETIRNTALGMIFNGSWSHCWLEYGPNTETLLQAAINKWVPDANEILVVLNNPNFGGCGGAVVPTCRWASTGRSSPTSSAMASVALRTSTRSPGTTPAASRAGSTSLRSPTGRTTKWRPVHRTFDTASHRRRKRGELQPGREAPLVEQQLRRRLVRRRGNAEHRHLPSGRELPDERQHSRVLSRVLHVDQDQPRPRDESPLPRGARRTLLRQRTERRTPSSRDVDPAVQENRSRLYATPSAASSVCRAHGSSSRMTRSSSGTSTGTALDEVVIFNGVDWAMPYLGLLVSDGAGGLKLIARYDGDIPGWGGFARNDRFYRANLNGDGETISWCLTATTGR